MRHLLLLSLSVFACVTAKAPAADKLTPQRCNELIEALEPGQEEVWRTIPWKLSVLEAQREAATEDKPIFIWAMDGHPLGCT